MIIWSGFGFVVVVFLIASNALCSLLVDAGLGAGYYDAHHWTSGVALLLAAALCTLFGLTRGKSSSRELVDAQTGERIVLRSRHTLFFIPVHLWAFVLGAIGVLLVVSELVR